VIISTRQWKGHVATVLLALTVGGSADAAVGFTLNFNPQVDPPTIRTGCAVNVQDCTVIGGDNINGGTIAGNDGSRFLQERLVIDGVAYFHVIVGDPASGFASESYVTATTYGAINQAVATTRSSSPDSGGMERSVIGDRTTLSVDHQLDCGASSTPCPSGDPPGNLFGNGKDPTGALQYTDTNGDPAAAYRVTGTGTMDPTRVVLRMVLSDAEMSLEVAKPVLSNKPLISQTTSDSTMAAKYVADMRGLSYDDMGVAAPVVNQLVIDDPNLPTKGVGNFDLSMTQRSNITAGKFTFTPGQGWFDITTGAKLDGWDFNNSTFGVGTYAYAEGGFDVLNVNWSKFFDYSQNAFYCVRGHRALAGVCPQ